MQIFIRPAYGAALTAVPIESSDTIEDVFRKYAQAANIQANSSQMRLSHHGRILDNNPHHLLNRNTDIQNHSIIDLLPRHGLRGGGGDGGSTGTESRTAFLEMYANKKPDKVNPEEERLARWTACHLSGMPLQSPIVCDHLGNLYNKDALLHALVTKTIPKSLNHISSIKHVFDVTLTPRNDVTDKNDAVRFACPVTEAHMNGKSRFVVIKTTADNGKLHGYVVSEKAMKELPQVVKEIIGGSEYNKNDVLVLYPQGEELEQIKAAVMAQRAAEKESKKSKNSRKRSEQNTTDNDTNDEEKKVSSKKSKSVVEKLMPADATPEVWQSLFGNKEKKDDGKSNNDYMVRGGLKYVA